MSDEYDAYDDELAEPVPDAELDLPAEADLSPGEEYAALEAEEDLPAEDAAAAPPAEDTPQEPSALGEAERLRQPRAQSFRRRIQTQISMLPLALFLVACGAYLLARSQDVEGLPNLSGAALAGIAVLVAAFTAVFHAVIFGRRERGLLFLGLWIWITAGLAAALVTLVEDHPDAREWWPLLIASLGITFVVTAMIERAHDGRLVLLGLYTLLAAGVAYGVTSGTVEQSVLDRASDYWPLLLSVIGLALLPLAFRRAE